MFSTARSMQQLNLMEHCGWGDILSRENWSKNDRSSPVQVPGTQWVYAVDQWCSTLQKN